MRPHLPRPALARLHLLDVLAIAMLLFYLLGVYLLAARQHESFHTHAFDMAYFDNVVWNTAAGRLFVNDLPDKPGSFLAEHFSPALIVLAPWYWVWSDARTLLAAQAAALALATLPSYLIVRAMHPRLAPLVLLGLLLNPSLLGVALDEFHEISLSVPLLSFALWALLTGRLRLMLCLLVAALAVKEEVAVSVAAVGVYLLASSRTPRAARGAAPLGAALLAVAVAWLDFVWGILPQWLPEAVSHWQLRYGDIASTPWSGAWRLLTEPSFLLSRYASAPKWLAVARNLASLAFLPLASPGLSALALPVLAYLMLSNKRSVSQLEAWYVAPLLPILFIATARAVAQAPQPRASFMTVALLVFSAGAYWQLAEGPLAQAYEPSRFAVTERTSCGHRLLSTIPPEASISVQDNLAPHLAHRRNLWVFPSMGEPLAEYVAIDARHEFVGGYSNWPTLRPLEVPGFVNRFLSDPAYQLLSDGCDYKILRYTGSPQPAVSQQGVFGKGAGSVALIGYEIAVKGGDGLYAAVRNALAPGQPMRVALWWQAGTGPRPDLTAFAHAQDAAGTLVGQHDSPPANGSRPTSSWAPGEVVRDLHYFSADGETRQIAVGLYDPRTGARLTDSSGGDALLIPLAK